MKFLWLIVGLFFSFSLQACFCCRCSGDAEDAEKQVPNVEKTNTITSFASVAKPLVTYDLEKLSLESEHGSNSSVSSEEENELPYALIAQQARRMSMDSSRSSQPSMLNGRTLRRSSIVLPHAVETQDISALASIQENGCIVLPYEAYCLATIIATLFPGEKFSLVQAEKYKERIKNVITYAQQSDTQLPADYSQGLDYLERIIQENSNASRSQAEAKK